MGAEDQVKEWSLDERWPTSQKVEAGPMLGSRPEAGGWVGAGDQVEDGG